LFGGVGEDDVVGGVGAEVFDLVRVAGCDE
jgi:hypothetical protein